MSLGGETPRPNKCECVTGPRPLKSTLHTSTPPMFSRVFMWTPPPPSARVLVAVSLLLVGSRPESVVRESGTQAGTRYLWEGWKRSYTGGRFTGLVLVPHYMKDPRILHQAQGFHPCSGPSKRLSVFESGENSGRLNLNVTLFWSLLTSRAITLCNSWRYTFLVIGQYGESGFPRNCNTRFTNS